MEYQLREEVDSSLTPIQQVFYNRGVYDIQHYIHPTEEDLSNPLLLDNLEQGIKCLISHIKDNDDIFILIDCDVDGYTSAALLINYLNKLFPHFTQTKIHYDIHNGKEHGLKDKINELLLHPEYKLIICPDSSSSDLEEHKKLRNNGQDVLILDHHQADEITKDRILINNQTCNYPNKELSGVGVVYQFCRHIDIIMNTTYSEELLDLVATGLVGDMVDVRSLETRFLILKGCENIPKNPLLKNLYYLSEYQIDKADGLNPFSIGFYIAPYINASIRIGEYDEKMFIFQAMLDFFGDEQILSTKRGHKVGELETWSVQASRLCSNIKARQQKLRDSALTEITSQIEENHLDQNKIIVIQRKDNQSNNLSGVIANQIMSVYQHPVLILKETVDEENRKVWSGSARGIKTKGFDSFRNFALNSNLTALAQGHDMAFGIQIPDENIQLFIEYSNKELSECDFSPYYLVDFIWQANDLNISAILEIAEYNTIWGQGLEEPKVAIENIHIKTDNVVIQGKGNIKVLKISLLNGLNLIQFGSAENLEQMKKDICPETARGDNVITIVGTCQRNVWNDQISAQIKIEGYNIVKKIKYYL